MSATQLLPNPALRPDGSGPKLKTCPFASNCSCVFAGPPPAIEPFVDSAATYSAATRAEIDGWRLRGFTVVSAGAHEVVLERARPSSLCANLLLTVATAFVWAFVWVRRSRNPRIERRTVTVTP